MHRKLTGLLVLAATLWLVACSGSGGGATATPSGGPQIAPGLQTPTATGNDGEPRSGGTLTILWADPPSLDPARVSDVTSARIVVEIFSGLVRLNEDLRIVPDLAREWEVGDDGTTYTFTLRDDARFSDGTPVTAADFKWSLERAAHPDAQSPVAELYLVDIVGIRDIIEGRATEASGIEVIDERTLKVTIDAPKAYFLAKLTYPTAFVLKRENVESGGLNWVDNPIGSGPFRLEEYRLGERLVLARNDNYYERPAYLDRVVLRLSGGVPMAMYEVNEIDVTGVSLSDLSRVQNPNDPLNRDLITVPPSFSVSYVGFKVDEPPFNDVKFRQALVHAVDKDLIAERVLFNLAVPARGVLPPQFPGFNENLQGLVFDPDKARQLLAESSYNSLSDREKRIIVTTPGTGGAPSLTVEAIISQWREVLGIEAEIQQVEWATYLYDVHRNRLQAFVQGWEADYPDPQDFLDILFHSQSPANNGLYSNPQVDELLERARTEPDVDTRMALYQEAEQIIVNEAAWLPLWWSSESLILVKPWVKNYQVSPMVVPTFKDVWIAR